MQFLSALILGITQRPDEAGWKLGKEKQKE